MGQLLRMDQKDRRSFNLYQTARLYFGSYAAALAAAGFDEFEGRTRWTRDSIIDALRQRQRSGKSLKPGSNDPELKKLSQCARYHFGSYAAALASAGFNPRDFYPKRHRIKW